VNADYVVWVAVVGRSRNLRLRSRERVLREARGELASLMRLGFLVDRAGDLSK
jgi:hypothetical protein